MRQGSTRREVGPLLRLAVPSIIAQLGQVMLGVVDAAVASRLSVHALDAVTLGSVWMVGTMMPLAGIVMGLGSLVSQAHGAGLKDEVALALQRALLLAMGLSCLVGAAWLNTERGLLWLGQDPELAHTASLYVRAQLFSAPCYLIYSALTTYLSSRGIVRIGIVTMVVANLFNALAAYSLTLGHWGFPALGIRGAALATGLTELLLPCVTALLIVRFELHKNAWIPWSRRVLDGLAMLRQLRLGIPTGVTIALELWAFQLGTILAGRIDHIALGAHAIALNLASMSFMVPLGFSIGTSTHVGQLIGAGERERAQHAAHTAFQLLALYAIGAGGLFVLAREFLPGLYSRDPNIVRAVASVLPIAGAFQLFDGLQAAGSGILRGMGRPQVTAVFNLVGYFAIGIPLASYLGLYTNLGLRGIWIGYAAGLGFVAAGLVGAVLLRGPRTAASLLATD
jgi:MATE family multidrug resistance protein